MATIKIELELVGTPSEVNAQKKILESLVKLPADDRDRLFQIIQSPKALKALKDKWIMLKMMFK